MRVRVTTPNVLKSLRKRDPGAAKPYNFALSPILIESPPNCTFVAPFSKDPKEWLTRDYVETNTGDKVKLNRKYRGTRLVPLTLSGVLWRHYLHPEDKSLSPDGQRCNAYTTGLLLRRPIRATTPFRYIGKEIARRAQEGEDISIVENRGPTEYAPNRTAKTRAADAGLVLRGKRFGIRAIMRVSGKSQHAVERFLSGARVFPSTRAKLAQAIQRLERESHVRTGRRSHSDD